MMPPRPRNEPPQLVQKPRIHLHLSASQPLSVEYPPTNRNGYFLAEWMCWLPHPVDSGTLCRKYALLNVLRTSSDPAIGRRISKRYKIPRFPCSGRGGQDDRDWALRRARQYPTPHVTTIPVSTLPPYLDCSSY